MKTQNLIKAINACRDLNAKGIPVTDGFITESLKLPEYFIDVCLKFGVVSEKMSAGFYSYDIAMNQTIAKSIYVTLEVIAEFSDKQPRRYYLLNRPDLCDAIIAQSKGELQTTNRELGKQFGCSEATVRNCRRSIL